MLPADHPTSVLNGKYAILKFASSEFGIFILICQKKDILLATAYN